MGAGGVVDPVGVTVFRTEVVVEIVACEVMEEVDSRMLPLEEVEVRAVE